MAENDGKDMAKQKISEGLNTGTTHADSIMEQLKRACDEIKRLKADNPDVDVDNDLIFEIEEALRIFNEEMAQKVNEATTLVDEAING